MLFWSSLGALLYPSYQQNSGTGEAKLLVSEGRRHAFYETIGQLHRSAYQVILNAGHTTATKEATFAIVPESIDE